MKLRDFALMSDENISPELVAFLRAIGFDVLDVKEEGLVGELDANLLSLSFRSNRVFLTHDQDFGSLAMLEHAALYGIVFLRPGHFSGSCAILSLRAVLDSDLDLRPPFLLVAENTGHSVRLRLRLL